MEKKILLALDDSLHSKYAVQYAMRMGSQVESLHYTLFSIQPTVSGFLVDDAKTDARARAALEKMKNRNETRTLEMLEGFRSLMTAGGIDEGRIEVKTQAKKIGLAKDILERAQEDRYDAIVAGRRGISKVQEMFMGSVTTNLIEHSRVTPVWVVDGDVTDPRILLAVDGSESALRAVDHISFMFSGSPEVKITLAHVVPRLKDFCAIDLDESDAEIEDVIVEGDKRCVQQFLVHAYNKFKDAGIDKSRIEIRELPRSRNIGKAILDEADGGGYGTLVFGRRGINKAFFMGSVSNYIINKAANHALWLVS